MAWTVFHGVTRKSVTWKTSGPYSMRVSETSSSPQWPTAEQPGLFGLSRLRYWPQIEVHAVSGVALSSARFGRRSLQSENNRIPKQPVHQPPPKRTSAMFTADCKRLGSAANIPTRGQSCIQRRGIANARWLRRDRAARAPGSPNRT